MKKLHLLFVLLLAMSVSAMATQKRKVLFIGIDGTRSDALQSANTPNIDALIAHGAYSYDAWCLGITVSGPSWSSMFTGVWYPKHGVTDNSYSGSQFDKYHEYPALAKQYKPGLYAAEVMEWPPLIDNIANIYDGYNVRIHVPDGGTTTTGTAALTYLADTNVDIMTIYYDKVDLTGHSSGFSPLNPAYISAIESVDANIGTVIAALHARPTYAYEDWLILLMTDHGGILTGHGANTDQERHIWFIADGTYIAHKQLNLAGTDPGSYRITPPGVDTTILKSVPVQTDIAVTALHFLLYDIPGIYPSIITTDSLDGKSWLDSIYFPPTIMPTAVQPLAGTNLAVKMYPNPTTNLVTLWFEHSNTNISYSVINAMGALVKQENNFQMSGLKLNIDLGSLSDGTYIIHVEADNKTVDKKVVIKH